MSTFSIFSGKATVFTRIVFRGYQCNMSISIFVSDFDLFFFQGFKKKSLSLSSICNKSAIVKTLEHTLREDENKLNLELPKIKRRRSIDVSKIEQLLNISDGEGQNNLPLPSITFSQYNSNVGLNQSVSNLNQI